MPSLEIDVEHCPPDWRDDGGFDEAEILIASHGGFGASGHAEGLAAYFDEVNGNGGVLGRDLRLESVNLAPGDAVQYLQGLVWALDQDPLAVSAVGGAAVSPEMAEQVDDACIPNLFWQTIRPVPDLAHREWTVPGFDSLDVEASVWLTWAVERYGADATVGVIAMDNGWGEVLLDAIESARRRFAPLATVEVVRHDPAAPDLAAPLADAAQSQPDVLIGATAGYPCLRLLVDRTALSSLAEVPVLLPSAVAIAPPEGVSSGMVVVTSADGVEQFGRLFAVEQRCGDRLVLAPLPWFIDDVGTRPGPYEVRVDVRLVSDQISASGRLPADGREIVLEMGSFLPPLD